MKGLRRVAKYGAFSGHLKAETVIIVIADEIIATEAVASPVSLRLSFFKVPA